LLLWAAVFGRELFIEGDSFWLWGAALPAVIGYTVLTSFLHGRSRFVALQTVAVLQGVIALVALLVLDAADELTVGSAIAAWTGSFLAVDVLCLLIIGLRQIDLAIVLRPRTQVLGEQVKYGAQGQLANMAALFNYRLDQYLVAALVSTAGVGQYTVAVGLAESVWWISSAVALVMLPRLTAMTEQAAQEVTPLVCRNTLLISILSGIALVAIAPIVIQVLFGDEYYPDSFWPLVLLMPGIIAGSASRVLGSYLFSQGKVIYNTYASLIALIVSIGLDIVAVPLFKVEGAAAMSSIAYICALIATLHWYRQVSGGSIREAIVPRLDDREHYMRILRRVSGRTQPLP
jgi:O-antigen/teichoic acid export membrane protein